MNFKKRVNGSWVDTPHYIHNTSTDTITTLPAVLYPNAATATVGLKGQATQSGTPTPDNPVMPQGTGERTGNLWAGDVPRYSYVKDYKKYNPDNAVYIKAGTYTISSDGKLPNFQAFDDNHTQYSISEIMTFSSAYYSVWDGLSISPISAAIHTGTITILADCIITLTVVDNLGTYIMLNTGSTPLPYEPYGYKIPISSANTTTPVYLGEVESTRKIKKLVLTGDEAFSEPGTYPGGYLYLFIPSDIPGGNGANAVSTHYKQAYNNNGQNVYIQSRRIVIIDATHSTSDDFKSYLAAQYAAGTPVTVWYILAEPTTGIVNEPLRKIGDYADTVSGITIPTIAGANSFDVLTTLKPSEVTVNYKGWHPVADVHEYDSNYTIATMQALTIAQLQTHIISELQGGEWS